MKVRNLVSYIILYLILFLPVLKLYGQCTSLSVAVTDPGPLCLGSTGYFQANINLSDEDGTYYTWYRNGGIVQQGYGAINYITNAITNGDKIKCKVSYSGSICVTGSPATSNEVTVSTLAPSVFIENTSGTEFCEGDYVYFEAVTNGNLSNFRWKLNNVSMGTNSTIFSTNQFTSGSVVSVTADAGNCPSVSANTSGMSITVKPLPSASLSPVGGETICSGCVKTITALPSSGSYSYHWLRDGKLINGATASTCYAGVIGTYRVIVTNNNNGCSKTSDNTFVLNKNNSPIANGGGNQTITSPINSITLHGSGSDIEGSALTYLWTKVSGSGVTLSGINTSTLQVTGLSTGSYTFRLAVSDGMDISYDNVDVKVNSPVNNYNYVQQVVPLLDNKKDPVDLESLNILSKEKNETVTYYDGLGRPIQSVTTQGSPLGQDIVQPIKYDAYGLEPIKYLPYVGGNDGFYKKEALTGTNGNYTSSPQYQFYQTEGLIPSDVAPFTTTVFETSSLNRVVKESAPGSTWQPDADNTYLSTDHTIKHNYTFNTENEVYLFGYDVTSGLINNISHYAANELHSSKTKDEHGNETIVYVDKDDRTVCKKVQYGFDTATSTILYACTYYIYDDLGHLVVVLPPEGVKALVPSAN
ncbi:MAG TPA: DUF6443 domain-containing protein [Cyclobacteriaceae bacterium]|nr:DUF6443 domain-containing protein [Cyclobacteriaceae bacterium]